MDGFEKLKVLLKSNLGYIGKFTEYLMNENIPFSYLETLYKDLVDLKSKQKPLDISSLKYEQVIDKVQNVRNELSINSLFFKISKSGKNRFINKLNIVPSSPGKKKLTDTLAKLRTISRVGNKVTSDDGKITIQLF